MGYICIRIIYLMFLLCFNLVLWPSSSNKMEYGCTSWKSWTTNWFQYQLANKKRLYIYSSYGYIGTLFYKHILLYASYHIYSWYHVNIFLNILKLKWLLMQICQGVRTKTNQYNPQPLLPWFYRLATWCTCVCIDDFC